MKKLLEDYLHQVLLALKEANAIPTDVEPIVRLERPKLSSHGDWSTNLALLLAKTCQQSPSSLAELIKIKLESFEKIAKVEIAGPGFINIWLHSMVKQEVISNIMHCQQKFGSNVVDKPLQILLEYVSANPTGPLHIGHGRAAAYGSSLANLLKKAGHNVTQEYYINDSGRQIDILTVSLYLRYLQCNGVSVTYPVNLYQGEYLVHIAKSVYQQEADKFVLGWEPNTIDNNSTTQEVYLDNLISAGKSNLGNTFQHFHHLALTTILQTIKDDLQNFKVKMDSFVSENSLQNGKTSEVIARLQTEDWIENRDNTLWFKSKKLGDTKDRVVVRGNGENTYFASDIAYHDEKLRRGFDQLINIWGADHHGYIARVKASITALGGSAEKLTILLVQFAHLLKHGERVPMSTRTGEFISLKDLYEEVGVDATRFFYCANSCEQHMNFDVDLAKSKTNDNPVYYIQYAHSRIFSVLQMAKNNNIILNLEEVELAKLQEPKEQVLIELLTQYPEIILVATTNYAPHQVANYLKSLAKALHSYYNQHKVVQLDKLPLTKARLCLLNAVKIVLVDGLEILNISVPNKM